MQLAADVADRHSGGTWSVELAGVHDPELVAAAVASTVGVRAEPDRALIETLTEYLAGRNALIVLDNCEQVLSSSAEFASALLRSAADLALLATAANRWGSLVAGLAVPALDPPSSAAAVRRPCRPRSSRLQTRRGRHGIDWNDLRTPRRPPPRHRTRRRAYPDDAANAIATALEDRFRLLTGGRRTAQPRQQTLEASVSWSHDLLDQEERALLRRLSVFNGGFTLKAAESVCADGTIDSYSVLDLLGRLVDKSLVQADDLAVEVRYRLLETIRHFARDRLLESGEADQARDRHLEWFLAYAERAEPELGTAAGPALMDQLDLEHLNLQTALEWADITGEHETVLRLATALCLFWEARGHRHQGIGGRWFAHALSTDQGPSVARARALWAAAHMGIYGGETLVTIVPAPEALEVALAVGTRGPSPALGSRSTMPSRCSIRSRDWRRSPTASNWPARTKTHGV